MFSTVVPERQPGGYYPGGVPVNVPTSVPPFPGAVAENPFGVRAADIQRDRPGKESNATVQYARIVVSSSQLAQAETADLERVGALALLVAYNPPGMFGADGETLFYGINRQEPNAAMRQMIDRLGSTPGLTGKGVNKPTRLVSYDYLTTLVSPSLETLPGLNQNGLTEYVAVFGNNKRSRLTHMINLATASANDYTNAGINLMPNRVESNGLDSPFKTFLNNTYKPAPLNALATNLLDDGFELNDLSDSPFLVPFGYCDFAKLSTIPTTEAWPPMGTRMALLHPMMQMRAITQDGGHIVGSHADDARARLYDALFNNERGLMSPVGIGPWRVDGVVIGKYKTFMDDETERAINAQQNALYNIAVGGQTIFAELSSLMLSKDPVGGRYGPAQSVYERAQQRLHMNQRRMTMPGDMVYLLIIGQVTKDGAPIADPRTGSDAKSRRNADGENRLTNIRLELSTSEELSRGSTPAGDFGFDGANKACLVEIIEFDDLPNTLPPNSAVYDIGDAEGANVRSKIVGTGRIQYNGNLYGAVKALGKTKVYIRENHGYVVVSIPATMEGTNLNTVKANLKTTARSEYQRLKSMGLAENEVIVGGWQLGRVIDSAATRAIANGAQKVSDTNGTFGLNLVVEIRQVTGLQLHQRYWSRTGVQDL